jgi:hypothetical protein
LSEEPTQALHNVRGPIGPLLHSGVFSVPQPRQTVVPLDFSSPLGFSSRTMEDLLGWIVSLVVSDGVKDVLPAMMLDPADACWMKCRNVCPPEFGSGRDRGVIWGTASKRDLYIASP